MSLELYVETYKDQYSRYNLKVILLYRDKVGYLNPGKNTIHFVFSTNSIIQRLTYKWEYPMQCEFA